MHTDLRESVLICEPLFFPQTLFESWTPNFGAMITNFPTARESEPPALGWRNYDPRNNLIDQWDAMDVAWR